MEVQDGTPEFPLPAYRNLSQMLSLPLEDGQSAEDIVAKSVRVLSIRGAKDKPSSRVTFKTEVNYGWEPRNYPGQLLAVHNNGSLLAYAMAERQSQNWAVRVINIQDSERILIKGMKGAVQDISFAFSDSRIMLAIVTEFGELHVHEIINEPRPTLSSVPMLHITHKDFDRISGSIHGCKVVWQPIISQLDEDVDASTLALLIGSKVEIWRTSHASDIYGAGEMDVTDVVAGGLTFIDAHKDIVTNGVFSLEGTAFASCSLDGSMVFCRLYMDEPPTKLRDWKAHDGLGLTYFCFLEDTINPNQDLWRYLITAANKNKDIRLWDCKDWSLIQHLTLAIEGSPKLALDASATILMASDQTSQTIFLFKVSTESEARFEAVSAYVLPFAVLSFCILRVDGFGRGPGLNGEDVDSDLSDMEDEVAQKPEGVISMYVISSQSLQHGKLQYLPPKDGLQLPLSTLAPDAPELPPPFTLMTPKELTSPASKLPENTDVPIKTEVVEAAVSGASSPSMEVSEILSHQDVELLAKEPVERVAIKQEQDSLPAPNWPSVPDTTSTPIRKKRCSKGKIQRDIKRATEHRVKKQMKSAVQSESLGKTPTLHEDFMGTPVAEQPQSQQQTTEINSELMKKLDAVITIVKNQDTQIKELSAKLKEKEDTGEYMRHALEAHARRVEEDVKRALDAHVKKASITQQSRRDAALKDDRQYLLNMLSQMIENHLSLKLTEVVPQEIRSTVLPVIVSELEPFKRKLHSEMTQQLSATDHLLKENISKLAQSKSVMDVLANSITLSLRKTLGETCKEIIATHMIPRLEKAFEKSFHQVNDSFAKGIREWSTTIQKESQRVQEEMKRAEKTMLTVISTNEAATIALNAQAAKNEQSFTALCGALTAQVSEALAKAAVVPPASVSRAMTPAVQTIERQNIIAQHLNSGQYNAAFKEALSASDLSVLMFTCEKVPAEQLFSASPCSLSQPVLLSLIQQLTADLSHNTNLKCRYLSEAIYQLEPNDPTTSEHLKVVYGTVEKHITGFLRKPPATPMAVEISKELNRVLKYFKILVSK